MKINCKHATFSRDSSYELLGRGNQHAVGLLNQLANFRNQFKADFPCPGEPPI